MSPAHFIKLWLWTGLVLVCAMVVIGGITRLTGSGLSMVEWKPVTGILPPLTSEQWQESFDNYKQFPEYQKLNSGMTLTGFKRIFFWEYLHRLLGRIIGIVFLLPFFFFLYKRWLTKTLIAGLLLILLLGALQGVMGWYMVKSGLTDIPHVSHFRLAAHQSLALLLIGAIFWTLLSLEPVEKSLHPYRKANLLMPVICLVLLFVQMMLGALVAGLKAGFSFTNFPFMGNSFFPPEEVVNSAPLLYNGAVLQFTHRWLGFIAVLSFMFLVRIPGARKDLKWLIALGFFQLALGATTLILYVPVALGVAHQFVAILLFIILIRIIHTLRRRADLTAVSTNLTRS